MNAATAPPMATTKMKGIQPHRNDPNATQKEATAYVRDGPASGVSSLGPPGVDGDRRLGLINVVDEPMPVD